MIEQFGHGFDSLYLIYFSQGEHKQPTTPWDSWH